MASLKDLIVLGPARFLDKLYGNLEGNAVTATKLQTPRAINGTNFDGTGGITTANWGTARNITIGSKTKSVNGSTTYNWTHAEIGATVSNTWAAGTTAGPKISTIVNGVTGTAVEIPSASTTASGVVTTGDQRFRGVKSLEYPAITSNASRYLGHYYKSSGGTTVGDHWLDMGDPSKVTQGVMYWRLYSPKATADTTTTGYYEQYYLPAVTIGRSTNVSYEIFTSKSYTTLDSRYVNVSGDTMTGQLILSTTVNDHTNPTGQALVINCGQVPSGGTLTDKNAPGIGFHIGNNSWGSLILNSGKFKFVNNTFDGYMPVYASTFYGALSGNASTATQLQTPRAINGTNFDGTAAITTANWGTARTLTIGATGKSVNGSSNVSWSPYEMKVTRAHYDAGNSMNTIADHGCELGMASLSSLGATVNPNNQTGWHHYINLTWSDCKDNNNSTTNEWCTQIANACGSTDLWVRSRAGGSIADGTAWVAPWTRILTGSNYASVLNGKYVNYYNSNTAMSSTEVVNTETYVHTVGTTGGNITTATKPTGMDNAWGVIHLHLHSGNYAMQLGFGGTTGHLYQRHAYNSTTFGAWKTILDSSNYTSYTVTKTGSGASGTWGISISGSSASCTGNAATATKLATARNITTNLASTSAASFNGTANITPGVTGTLPLGNGGTGVTSLNALRKLFREWAPIDSSNDTTANWGAKGLSVAGYSDGNTITDKPSTYGIILNVNSGDTEVHQLWFTQSSGKIFHRGGNASGWNGSWRLMYSDGDSVIYSSSEPTSKVKGTIWLKPA